MGGGHCELRYGQENEALQKSTKLKVQLRKVTLACVPGRVSGSVGPRRRPERGGPGCENFLTPGCYRSKLQEHNRCSALDNPFNMVSIEH